MSIRRLRPALIALLAGVLLMPGVPAAGQSADELREQIGEASAAETAALRDLDEVRGRRAQLDAAVRELDAQVLAAVERIAAAQRQVDLYTSASLELTERVDATRDRLRAAQERFAASAAELYRSGGSGNHYVTLALEARSARDLFSGAAYLEQISRERRADIDGLESARRRVERLVARAEKQRQRAEAAGLRAASEGEQLAALRRDQARRRDALAAEEARERDLVASIRARKDAFTADLAALEATSQGVTQMLQAGQDDQPATDGFRVVRPVSGAITSGFGPRVHPILGTTRTHMGVDMHAGHGEPIRAGAAGEVVWAGPRQGYGNTVIIDHGNRYATLYAHASAVLVASGQEVAAGETVARVGATGLATGPHLHFEVRLLGVPQNPVNYL